ncbi:ERF family protein [Streptomyces diastaticus]|uniref:ERF family protein n=1 Tax=Streptomyces diastaticus TaxID=1956 RepID=UPI003693BABE
MTVTALPLPQAPAAEDVPRVQTAYVPAPLGTPADAPRIFQVIHGVMRDVMPVGKSQENKQQNYRFRGVDDAMNAMAGPMRNHGCFIAPEMVDHKWRPRGEKGTHTVVTMRYRIYGPAGDCLVVTLPGEAMDMADKSTNKAMSAALKYMLFQVFMIPVDARSIADSDRDDQPPTTERQPNRQGRQQQRHQRHQQGGQTRRSNRAEPGPQEQHQQQAPRPDYMAEAQRAACPEAFAKVRAAAEQAGAPADYLARLDQVAEQKRAAAEQGQQQTPRQPQQSGPPPSPEAAAQAAESALRIIASRANLATLDADFERVYGLPIEQATSQQLDQFRAKIEATGGVK